MIQPEPEGSTQGYPLVSVEVFRKLKEGGEVSKLPPRLTIFSLAVSKLSYNLRMIKCTTKLANVVADVLSRKERVNPKRVRAMNMTLQSSIKDGILTAQKEAMDESVRLQKGLDEMIEQISDGTLYYLDQIWEAAKFVGDFKFLVKEADESLTKHKALELEIERLLRAVASQDIMSIVQKASVVDTLNLQTELEPQLGDLKGKSKDTTCVSDTLNSLSQKLKNENVKLEFQVLNYAKENAHLKTIYKNVFDSISVSRTQTKIIIASLQHEIQNTIYENAKLRAQLFKKVSVQKDNTRGMSTNTKFAKQSIVGNLPKVGETHALTKPVTSNSISTPQESKVVKNDKVIAPGMFRINPFMTSREEKHVPNTVRASARTKPITVSQPPVITKKVVNSDSNGLSSTEVDNTKTRRPQHRSNTKNDRVKENQKKDKIGSKPDKNGKRVEARKSLKQLQWVEEEKLSKTQKEWPKTQTQSKAIQTLKE
nr:putative reverse transcriptase domain-containing protein [Tanacetum cinerariifolium]